MARDYDYFSGLNVQNGDHLIVYGLFVRDRNHPDPDDGGNKKEIHPVFKVTKALSVALSGPQHAGAPENWNAGVTKRCWDDLGELCTFFT